jgi:hypothetical protein
MPNKERNRPMATEVYNRAIERLDRFRREGRLIRGQYNTIRDDGKTTACLLSALSSRVWEEEDPNYCPTSIMPTWLAHVTIFMNDAGTDKHWPDVVAKYSDLAHRWSILKPHQWTMLDYRFRAIAIRFLMEDELDQKFRVCALDLLELIDKSGSGKATSARQWDSMLANLKPEIKKAPFVTRMMILAMACATDSEETTSNILDAIIEYQDEAGRNCKIVADGLIDDMLKCLEREIAKTEAQEC